MMEVFTNLVCRPPRYTYDLETELGPSYFKIDDAPVHRRDLQVRNGRGLLLHCSHYVPIGAEEYPVVIYCHGNAGARTDADDTVNLLLPFGISVFTFDFSGSGMSEGDLCSLGFHERGDLQCIIKSLEENPRITKIGVWGRSMGAATALMVAGEEDLGVSAMVLDSCFLSLESVATDVACKYLRKVPFLESWLRVTRGADAAPGEEQMVPFLNEGVQMLRAGVLARCAWDIRAVNPEASCERCSIPALFLHAEGDTLVQLRHSQELFAKYAHSEKQLETFEGDHNTLRPEKLLHRIARFLARKLKETQDDGEEEEEEEGEKTTEGAEEEEKQEEEEDESQQDLEATPTRGRPGVLWKGERTLSPASASAAAGKIVDDKFLIHQMMEAERAEQSQQQQQQRDGAMIAAHQHARGQEEQEEGMGSPVRVREVQVPVKGDASPPACIPTEPAREQA
eukprot:CAMPEP_0177747568 /NCGR_PEP_ID=MMETSP0484_2-20121128/31467_1 /TAXON_ID=354590 /ORGANISM="Rhodomonas lens, Strain RHODO" /LENGTH=452 /DNA_ID=CAMNT_0019262383 /DNA_START=112 /DNA_END=1466 /DNA_ORIENTATION=+